jgi:hypothetical protein
MNISEFLYLSILVLVFMEFILEVIWYIKYCKDHPEPKHIKKTCPHGYEEWDECPVCGH